MTVHVFCVTFDCRDPALMAEFWAAALSYQEVREGLGSGEAMVEDPSGSGSRLLFYVVPEEKTLKNRLHLDLEPEGSIEAEVERLVSLGARELRTLRDPETHPDPWLWTVMEDPEGNEFCVGKLVRERT